MIVVVDNFDSFTYNLVQMLSSHGQQLSVLRNDASLEILRRQNPDALVISPGPGRPPDDTGVTCEAIRHFAGKIPILGVCLGHQAIGQVFGAKVISARQIMHGKASQITHNDVPLFAGIANPFTGGRYHSLALEKATLPDCLEIIAQSEDGEIMAVRHRQLTNVWGVQFHPESLLTSTDWQNLKNGAGYRILANFLAL